MLSTVSGKSTTEFMARLRTRYLSVTKKIAKGRQEWIVVGPFTESSQLYEVLVGLKQDQKV